MAVFEPKYAASRRARNLEASATLPLEAAFAVVTSFVTDR